MFRTIVSSVFAVVLSLSAGGATAQQTLLEVPVGAGFTHSELGWDTNMGKIDIAWSVLGINGATYVCGATSATKSFAHRNTTKAFRKGWIKVNDRKVMSDLSFFTRAPRKTDLKTVKARCKALPGNAGQAKQFLLGFDPVRVRM
ncbi:hypothetical protein [Antarctobacter sp.]|uniref:hypothetical protein n=1 Tax=Antarctobacter sp. TaxID=1872577 RepID=UPI002B26F71B|nr:hypothetical protein [Antarctobacter sp.]